MLGFLRGATHRVTGAARWVVTVAVGLLLIAVGIVMLFTPGPGWGAIILGLYLWAREFDWARRLLDRMVARLEEHRHRLPDFVGRLLDERNRRKEIKRTADQVATGESPVESGDRSAISRGGASAADA